MKKEYAFIFIAGLFLLAYVLEAVVNPLNLNLTTPYDYLSPVYMTRYPFTTAIILIRATALFILPVLLFSFLKDNHTLKGVTLLIVAGLAQLYAIQEIATKAQTVPLEWNLSLSLAGMALLLPVVLHLLIGAAKGTHRKLTHQSDQPAPSQTDNQPG